MTEVSIQSLQSRSEPAARRWVRAGWPLYASLAVLFGIYEGINQYIGLHSQRSQVGVWKPMLWELSSVCVIAALIPLILRFERRIPLDSRPRSRVLLAHLGGAVAFSAVHTAGMVFLRKLIYALFGDSYEFGNVLVYWFYELQKDLITYVVILLIVFAVREFRVRRAGELRAAALSAELSDARLRHLTTQIEPHFLFNTLNAISNRMHEDVEVADRMITQLGDLLRAAYESGDHLLVPLDRELGWLRGYAAMMSERFRGQLTFEIEVAPDLDSLQVPRLLLQPIVENAIRHGLGDGHGWLRVAVRQHDRRLQYIVSDDGVGLPAAPLEHGTGLSNIARRLELLFPNDHTLCLAPRTPRGTEVTVSFPVSQ